MDVVKRISERVHDLFELLCPVDSDCHEVFFLFFDPGWKQLLREPDKEENKFIEFANVVRKQIHEGIKRAFESKDQAEKLNNKIRIITASDVCKIAKELKAREDQKLFRWFVGEAGNSTYDSPKIVEAMIRLRLIGRNVPVFRVDHDVLLPPDDDETAEKNPTGFTNDDVTKMVTEYNNRLNGNFMCWMFSAGYKNDPDNKNELNEFEFWSRAFATRVQPTMVATRELCQCVEVPS
ncbi:MAG: hypothetical protein GY854_23135 [Deltaproteobacteria bacterium]|nr:hypothetical protein [Deltaproteobacteria bacterium]